MKCVSQVDLDVYAPLDEAEREPSANINELTVSVSSASTAEEGASAIPGTRITSESPDIPPADTSMDQLSRNQPSGVDPLTKSTFDAGGGEQISGWIAALQRLVKGKVYVKDEVSPRV